MRENRGVEVPEENCFLGFDAYERLIDSGVDVGQASDLRARFREMGVEYVPMHTETPFDTALLAYLEKRSHLG